MNVSKIFRFFKGRAWCLTFHAPVIRELGGYGGSDHFGRRRRAYHSMWCVKCGNRWDQDQSGERTLGSHMWHFRQHEKQNQQGVKK